MFSQFKSKEFFVCFCFLLAKTTTCLRCMCIRSLQIFSPSAIPSWVLSSPRLTIVTIILSLQQVIQCECQQQSGSGLSSEGLLKSQSNSNGCYNAELCVFFWSVHNSACWGTTDHSCTFFSKILRLSDSCFQMDPKEVYPKDIHLQL